MIDESEKMVLDTESRLNKAAGELKDLVVSPIVKSDEEFFDKPDCTTETSGREARGSGDK